jgi:hypothetical protein
MEFSNFAHYTLEIRAEFPFVTLSVSERNLRPGDEMEWRTQDTGYATSTSASKDFSDSRCYIIAHRTMKTTSVSLSRMLFLRSGSSPCKKSSQPAPNSIKTGQSFS